MKKSENQKKSDSNGKRRMKRFEENQSRVSKESTNSKMCYTEYMEKNVLAGDIDWHRRVYVYDKSEKINPF